METKKVLGIIFSLLFVAVFGFTLTWGIINFNKVKEGMSGTELYTSEDLNNSYQDGYDTALKDKVEYEELINGYRDNLTTLTDNISSLNSQISSLTNVNKDYQNQIESLNNTISTSEKTVNDLEIVIENNELTIENLNTEIANYNNQISDLEQEIIALEKDNNNKTAELMNKQNQVSSLNNQINSLQSLVNQLNLTNEANLATISTLNNQIQSLNAQISDLKLQINNNNSNVGDLNDTIADLQKSIEYYEQYISSLETETNVVVTFEFDGSVYNVQILNKGGYASVVNPISTEYVIFNGWTINDEIVDLNTYAINQNVKFVADVTYKYAVEFIVDNTVKETQIIETGYSASVPTIPIKEGYEFDGWSVDGVNIIDVSNYEITAKTSFVAMFTKTHTVTFMYEAEKYNVQTIRNGEYAENVIVEDTIYKIFNGWLENETTVNLSTYKITADTVFVADLTYKYDVKFMVDDEVYTSEIVTANSYILNPESPNKYGYVFKGWSLDGVNVIDVSTNPIASHTTFIAVFEIANILVSENGVQTNFKTFDEALTYASNITSSSTNRVGITLFEDASFSSSKTIMNRYIDLDVNGFTLTGSYFTYIAGEFTITDSSLEHNGLATFGYIKVDSSAKVYLNSANLKTTYYDYGVYIVSGSFIMNGGTFAATGSGPKAVYLKNVASRTTSFTMNDGVITSTGYGVYASGYSNTYKAFVTINSGEIKNCTNEAFRLYSFVTATVKDANIENNLRGFIVFGESSSYKTSLTLTNVSIKNNHFEGSEGGAAMWVYSYSTVSMNNCIVEGNTAQNYGGGLMIRENSSVFIGNSTISNNSAKYGGGICMWGGTLTLSNSKIMNNNATTSSGGIYNSEYDYATINIKDNSFVSENYLNGANSNVLVTSTTTVKIYSTFTGTIGFTHPEGVGTVAEFAESTMPSNCKYLSDEGRSITAKASTGVVLS